MARHGIWGAALLALVTCLGTTGAPAATAEWQPLLEASAAPAWRGWKSPGLPAGWQVRKGTLSKQGEADDLISVNEYASFELEFEWKIGKGGNSGLFFRGTREYEHIYWSAPEYQLLDDANAPDGANRLTAAGAGYALYPAEAGVVAPHNHWNRSRLVVRGAHVEQWLNDRMLVAYELSSEDWQKRVAASKFAAYPGYGKAAQGFLGIQGDHPGALSIRAMRIRELP